MARRAILLAACLSVAGTGACSDVVAETEEKCLRDARTIVHDQALWLQYRSEAERTYQERAIDFPNTRKVVAEYAAGFEHRYGPDLRESPQTQDGAVVRQDLFIVKDGRPVAQFVNYYGRYDFAGPTVVNCLATHPTLYTRMESATEVSIGLP